MLRRLLVLRRQLTQRITRRCVEPRRAGVFAAAKELRHLAWITRERWPSGHINSFAYTQALPNAPIYVCQTDDPVERLASNYEYYVDSVARGGDVG